MARLLHQLITEAARVWPDRPALAYKDQGLSYAQLAARTDSAARGFATRHLDRGARVAIYLEKRPETVIAIFAATMAGGCFVPVNPLLKPQQVSYILRDCGVRILITSQQRLAGLRQELQSCPELQAVVLVDAPPDTEETLAQEVLAWKDLLDQPEGAAVPDQGAIDADMAGILYTSGSTGNPKGVVLSHRNIVAGAESVAQYLENRPDDRILSVLPLSFDAGLSQITTAFTAGAKLVLMNYLLPRDVVRLCAREQISGLTCVPPLWLQIAELEWPPEASRHLRYFANTGGHMPAGTLARLRDIFTGAKPYLMYGLTEAFRSTYLDPQEVDRRPNSIGKAIPNAEVMVVRPDGSSCAPREHGELIHRGALVSLGYWGDSERTAERFRPAPGQDPGLPLPELAVWSGDIVYTDEEGFIYFVGRRDEMIKTSGYRVSPTEVENVINATGLVAEAVAFGVPHPTLGQAIVVVVTPGTGATFDPEALKDACRQELPLYMLPSIVAERGTLPRNPNGKIDRALLKQEFLQAFPNEEANDGQ